jgi:hypothetical protein
MHFPNTTKMTFIVDDMVSKRHEEDAVLLCVYRQMYPLSFMTAIHNVFFLPNISCLDQICNRRTAIAANIGVGDHRYERLNCT